MPLPDIEPASLGMGMFSNNKTPTGGGLFDGIGGKEEPTNTTSGIGEMFKNPPIGNGLDFDSGEDEEENKKFEKLEIDKIEIKTAEIGKLIVDSLVTKDEEEKSTVEEQEEDKKSEMAEKILPSLVEESKEIPDILGDSSNEPKTAIDKETQLDTTNPLSTIIEPIVAETSEETATVLEPMVSETATVIEPMVSKEAEETATVLEPTVLEPILSKEAEETATVLEPMVSKEAEETATVLEPMVSETATVLEPMVSKEAEETTSIESNSGWEDDPLGTLWDNTPLMKLFGGDEETEQESESDVYGILVDIRDIISEFDFSDGNSIESPAEETPTQPTEETAWGFSDNDSMNDAMMPVANLENNIETVTNNTENLEYQTKSIEENIELKTIEDAQVTVPPNISEQQNKQQKKSSFYSQPNQNTTSPPANPGPKYTKNPPQAVPAGKSIGKELQTYIIVPQWRRMLG